jgi:threonine/homoserine/homoserine lactone efflux protein
MTMAPLWGACLAGLTYGLMLGPLFVAALRQTQRHGTYSGITVWAGAFISDLVLLGIGLFGAEMARHWFEDPAVTQTFSFSAGILMWVLGVVLLWNKPKTMPLSRVGEHSGPRVSGYMGDFATGFSINTVNIGNGLFWLGVAAMYPHWEGISLSLVGLLPAVAVKHYLCLALVERMRPRLLSKLMRITGVLLLILGAVLVYQGV